MAQTATRARAAGPTAGRTARAVIDCDIHIAPSSGEALGRFLSADRRQ